jgi:hypothetical protein
MQSVGDTMLSVLPLVYSTDRAQQLPVKVAQLSDIVQQAAPHFESATPTVKSAYGLLSEQLQKAARSRSTLSMRAALADSFELCSGCHIQDRITKPAFGISRLRELDEFQAGVYSYMTRDYPSAVTSFGNYLAGSGDARQRSLALDKLLVMTAGIDSDLTLSLSTFEGLLGSDYLTVRERSRVNDWLREIRKISAAPSHSQSPLRERSINAIDRYLSRDWPQFQSLLSHDAQQVYWVMIRGQLYRLLQESTGSRHVPKLLYWLAVSDRALLYRFYNSLSRRYLEQCMTEYTSHPYARTCFKEYELMLVVSFSGSGGINLPVDEQDRISELRRLVYAD